MKKIAIIGECMIELNGDAFGHMYQTYGGDTLNTATYLTRITPSAALEVQYISVMGTDKLSQQMIEHWQTDGINTNWVLRDPKRHAGLYLIQLDTQGERTFLYWRNQSAARYLLQHIDIKKVFEALITVDMIYLSGISLAILPDNDRISLLAELTVLAKQGVKIAFDSNYRPALWESREKTQEIYTALLPIVDLALVTFEDEHAIWQDKNAIDTIHRLKQMGVKDVVVKQGKSGAIFSDHHGNQCVVPTQEVKNIVDTTSAGDAFNAGFLNGYLQGKPLYTCCEQGHQLARLVIQHRGAIIDKSVTSHLINKFN
ncbi:sugar kinase [Pasteurella multocida]|uniref:sugar kinase n=1 Tax=Pasteurella multocida TaxID=747 RepID=UPI0029468981|nr:sugar kinase [Pasteurella multocida]MEE3748973.1 sugar kinase [Pasteurella multocida]HDR1044642.1 sugar kinase [Pasteurella multocida]HDR1046170.1 sugar kinase [Pasteurella multocida]HDR1049208.1 sugar kinase [Pasteurella multocida]